MGLLLLFQAGSVTIEREVSGFADQLFHRAWCFLRFAAGRKSKEFLREVLIFAGVLKEFVPWRS